MSLTCYQTLSRKGFEVCLSIYLILKNKKHKKQKTLREAVEFFTFYGCIFAVLSVVVG